MKTYTPASRQSHQTESEGTQLRPAAQPDHRRQLADNSPQVAKLKSMATTMSSTVQRKVGFEFETSNLVSGADPKEKIFSGTGFHIDADTAKGKHNHIEFVTDPADTLDEAKANIDAAANKAKSVNPNSKIGGYKVASQGFDPKWPATAQHTEGVSMEELSGFLQTNLEDSTGHADSYGVFKSRMRISGKESEPEEGMAQLVMWYVYALKHWTTNSDTTEGPKNAMGIMSRTDFYSMYSHIKQIGREAAYKHAEAAALIALDVDRDDPLIPAAYPFSDEGGERLRNPLTVGQWLDSFTRGFDQVILDKNGRETKKTKHRNKDELSAPLGFRHLDPEYSMGAMAMDGNLVLIESRSRANMEEVPLEHWNSYADQVFGEIDDRKPQEEVEDEINPEKFWDEDYGMTPGTEPESDDTDGYA